MITIAKTPPNQTLWATTLLIVVGLGGVYNIMYSLVLFPDSHRIWPALMFLTFTLQILQTAASVKKQ